MSETKLEDAATTETNDTTSRRQFLRQAGVGAASVALGSGLLRDGVPIAKAAPQQAISGNLTVWCWPNNDTLLQKGLPYFYKLFPNVKVKILGYPNADTTYATKLLTAMVSGSGPDIAMIEISVMAKFRTKPGLVDLSQAPYNAGQYKSSYVPFAWNYVVDPKSGHIAALPKTGGPGCMYYRRDHFKAVGLPTDPTQVSALVKDWDAFISVGKKLSVKNSRWMVGTAGEIATTIMAQAGVSWFDKNGVLQFGNPILKTALQYAQEAWKAGIVSPMAAWTQEWGAAIGSGQLVTLLSGSWMGNVLTQSYAIKSTGVWETAVAPAYAGHPAFNAGGDFISIMESSSNKAAAWEYIKFVTQNNDSLRVMYTLDYVYPDWKASFAQPWLSVKDPYFCGQNLNTVFAPIAAKAIPQVINENDPIASAAFTDAVNAITQGNSSIDKALSQAEAEVHAKMG